MSAVESGTHTVRLTVPAKPEYIVLTRLALSAVCRLTPLQPEDVADMKLAVTEAATGLVREDVETISSRASSRSARTAWCWRSEVPTAPRSRSRSRSSGGRSSRATVDECEFGEGSVTLVKYLTEPEQ